MKLTLGEMIREKRMALGLTQQQLADKVYVTRQTISKWELGKSQPDQLSLNLLANILQLKGITERKEGRAQTMSLIRDLFGLIFFGVLFLPLRMIWIVARKKWKTRLVQYVGIPLAICLYTGYMHSLTTTAFYVVLLSTILLYFGLRIYFPLNQSADK